MPRPAGRCHQACSAHRTCSWAECWRPVCLVSSGAGGQPGRECSEDPPSAASDFTLLVTKADLLLFFTRKKCIDLGILPMIQEVNS